jgi:hypothetical protein
MTVGLRIQNARLWATVRWQWILLAALVVGLIVLGKRAPYVGVIAVDRQAGVAAVYGVPAVDGAVTTMTHDLAAAFWMPLVVQNIFSIDDPDHNVANFKTFVVPFVAGGSAAETAIRSYLSTLKPNDVAARDRVKINVDPLGPPSKPNVYYLTWTATTTRTRDGKVLGVKRYATQIAVRWEKPRPIFDERGQLTTAGNPVGLYVTEIAIPDTSDPGSATGPLAPPSQVPGP